MSLLEVKNLCKIYGQKETTIHALDNVSFTVEEGEFVSIIGASGSGKSTLLHILGGVDKPTSGEVIVEGKNIYKLSDSKMAKYRRNKVGLIYQFYNLIPILNVYENITLPSLLDKRKIDNDYCSEIIKTLNLEERITHLPNELSGGQQQRVAIARSLINHPPLLLADEPTGNLDSKNSDDIIELFKLINEKYHQTIIIITHDILLAKKTNRMITINDGKIISDVKVEKI